MSCSANASNEGVVDWSDTIPADLPAKLAGTLCVPGRARAYVGIFPCGTYGMLSWYATHSPYQLMGS